jgi:hypothetical protein
MRGHILAEGQMMGPTRETSKVSQAAYLARFSARSRAAGQNRLFSLLASSTETIRFGILPTGICISCLREAILTYAGSKSNVIFNL